MSDPAAWGLDTMSTRKPALSVFANVAGFTYRVLRNRESNLLLRSEKNAE